MAAIWLIADRLLRSWLKTLGPDMAVLFCISFGHYPCLGLHLSNLTNPVFLYNRFHLTKYILNFKVNIMCTVIFAFVNSKNMLRRLHMLRTFQFNQILSTSHCCYNMSARYWLWEISNR